MRYILMLLVLFYLTISGINAAFASGEQNLLVFYSNDVIGETEPCG